MQYKVSKHLSYDIRAGITVFLVAIPLCLGIALASGAPVISGIISGAVGGIVVGFLSGSHLSVSGPAAGLVTVVLAAIVSLGSFQIFLLSIIIAGVFQIILGYLKAGVIAHYIPYGVLKGMLAAIGIILILKQIPHAFGYDNNYEGSLSFTQESGSNTLSAFLNLIDHLSLGAIIITAVSFLCLYLFSLEAIKKHRVFKYMPGALVAIIIAAVLNKIFQLYIPSLALYGKHLVHVPNLDFNNINRVLFFPDFKGLSNILVYKYAFIIAIIGSIETLLCIEAADKLDKEKRVTPTSRELKSQGVGNIISGFLGGLPITSVIVRTSVNVENNAKSKSSSIIHGLLLAVCLFIGTTLINQIPLAALSAVLIVVGYKLVSKKLIREMFHRGLNQFIPFIVTIAAVFFTDILVGVLVGLIISTIFILKNYYNLQNFDLKKDVENKNYILNFSSYTTFLSKASIQKSLNLIPSGSSVTLNFEKAKIIDSEIHELIEDFMEHAKSINIQAEILSTDKFNFNHSVRK